MPRSEKQSEPACQCVPLTSLERSLLSLALRGNTLAEAAAALDISALVAQAVLERLQERCGVPCRSRLIALAILHAWV